MTTFPWPLMQAFIYFVGTPIGAHSISLSLFVRCRKQLLYVCVDLASVLRIRSLELI